MPSATTENPNVAVAESSLGSAAEAQSAEDPMLLDGSSEEVGPRYPPQSGGSLAIGTDVIRSNPSLMEILQGSADVDATGDANDVLGDDLTPVLDGELGDGNIDIQENIQNTFDTNAEDANEDSLVFAAGGNASRFVRWYVGFPSE